MLCYIALSCATLVMLCYIALRCVVLCCGVLRCITMRCISLFNVVKVQSEIDTNMTEQVEESFKQKI